MLPALHSLEFRVHTRTFVTLFVVLALTGLLVAASPTTVLLHEAAMAQKAGDNPQFVAKLEAARALRPDYPRVLYVLARAYLASGRPADAAASLSLLARMGLVFEIAKDPALAGLKPTADFAALERHFAENAAPRGGGRSGISLPAQDGIIEGIARDAAGNFYFGDVRNRCIWRRSPSGGLARFGADPAMLGVFGLKVDDAGNTLWAATSAVAEMKNTSATSHGRAELLALDLASGTVRRRFPLPDDGRDHVLGDLALAPDGSVFATDSLAPVIWRLAPHGKGLQRWLESDDFSSLQGLAFAPDGRSLVVADYANGLWRIALADQAHVLMKAPADTTLFGIDGLYPVAGGLIAVQNGVSPQRVVRIALDAAGGASALTVLESGHPAMDDLSLGVVADGSFHFIGNSGWSLFDPPTATAAPRAVSVFSTPL